MRKMRQEQKRYVLEEVKNTLEKYQTRTDVDCIYLLCYEEKGINNFDIVIVFEKELSVRIKKEFNKINNVFSYKDSIECFGGIIKLIGINSNRYFECRDINLSQTLLSSEILYDKTGKYTKLANRYGNIDLCKESFKLR